MAEAKIAGKSPCKVELEAGDHWWCSCGESKAQPLCDGSHKGTSFTPVKFSLGEAKEVYLCACKRTQNAPYCDGAHKKLA